MIRIAGAGTSGPLTAIIINMTSPTSVTITPGIGNPMGVTAAAVTLVSAPPVMTEAQAGPYIHIGSQFGGNPSSGLHAPETATANNRAPQIWTGNIWGTLGSLAANGPYSTNGLPPTTQMSGNSVDNAALSGGPFQLWNYNGTSVQADIPAVTCSTAYSLVVPAVTPYTGFLLPPLQGGLQLKVYLGSCGLQAGANTLAYPGYPVSVASGTYTSTSGVAIMGSMGQTCTLTFPGGPPRP